MDEDRMTGEDCVNEDAEVFNELYASLVGSMYNFSEDLTNTARVVKWNEQIVILPATGGAIYLNPRGTWSADVAAFPD